MCDPEHHASIYTDGGEAVTKAVRPAVRSLVRPATPREAGGVERFHQAHRRQNGGE
jgi:hypothetical protein